jgi:hypothetical protein
VPVDLGRGPLVERPFLSLGELRTNASAVH